MITSYAGLKKRECDEREDLPEKPCHAARTDPSVSLRVLWFWLFHHLNMSALSPPGDATQVFKPGQVRTGDVSVLV